jgi:phospholipase/carboxylesterase
MKIKVVEPSSSQHNNTVIFLHGLGSNGKSTISLLEEYIDFQSTPNTKWIFPTAPKRYVTFAKRTVPSWYDIRGRSVFAYLANKMEDCQHIHESSEMIHHLIETEIQNGTPSNRIILAGASQGGAMALYCALTFQKQLAGVFTMSTYLPNAKKFLLWKSIRQSSNTPFLICHGKQDKVIPHFLGSMSYYFLKIRGVKASFKSYADLGHHDTSDEQMKDMLNYLNTVVQ